MSTMSYSEAVELAEDFVRNPRTPEVEDVEAISIILSTHCKQKGVSMSDMLKTAQSELAASRMYVALHIEEMRVALHALMEKTGDQEDALAMIEESAKRARLFLNNGRCVNRFIKTLEADKKEEA